MCDGDVVLHVCFTSMFDEYHAALVLVRVRDGDVGARVCHAWVQW